MLKKIYFAFLIVPFSLIGDDHKAQGNSTDWEIEERVLMAGLAFHL